MPATVTDTVLKELTGFSKSDDALAIYKARAVDSIKRYMGSTKYDNEDYNDRINGCLVDLVKIYIVFEGSDSLGIGDVSISQNYSVLIGGALRQLGPSYISAPST